MRRLAAPLAALLAVGSAAQAREPALTRPPELIEAADAEYPPEAGELEADVKILLHIDAGGAVTAVDVPEPAGHGFDAAARAAGLKYTFHPAEFDGKPGPIVVETVIHFRRQPAPPPEPVAPEPAAPEAGATQPAGTSVLEGTVKERGTRRALAGVAIAVGAEETETDAAGHFHVAGLAAGAHPVVALRAGFDRLRESITLADGETTEVTLYLRPSGGSPYETTVEGEREKLEVTKRTMGRRELTTVPGTFGDPLRVIQNLPGMARAPYALGLLLVRGSDPNDTGVFIDGHDVPLLYHFLGGPSILNPEFLESIDLYPSGFPARYGRFHGGVVEVNTRSPKSDGVHGSAKVDLLDTGVYLRAPLGKHVTFAVAGRRSYIDQLLPYVLPKPDPGDTLVVVPVYWDYQARLDVELPHQMTLSLLGFGSDDRLDLLRSDAAQQQMFDLASHIGFHRLRATLTVPLAGDLKYSISPVVGRDVVSLEAGERSATGVTNTDFAVRERLWGRVLPKLHFDAGLDLDYRVARYDLDIANPVGIRDPGMMIDVPPELVQRSTDTYGIAAYAEVAWDVGPVRVIPGLRSDLYLLNGKMRASVNPRVVARWQALPKTTIKGYVGLYHEPPPPEGLDNVFGNPDLGLERALHTGAGVEQQLTRDLSLELEGYRIGRDNLAIFTTDTALRGDGTLQRLNFVNSASGDTWGLELLLKHKVTEHFYGWLSYTLSRSRLSRDAEDTPEPTAFDQTHNLIAVASYRFRGGWEAGARFRYSTGRPRTPFLGSTYDADADRYRPLRGDRNTDRMPSFSELDLRVDKTWLFQTWSFGAYLDVINVTNADNPEAIQYDYRFRDTAPVRGVPIVPTVGVKGQW